MHRNNDTQDALYKAANDIYSLYFIGWLLGFLAFIIGAVWAGMRQRNATGITQSHFSFQLSMAVQGCIALLVLSLLNGIWYWLLDGAWLKLMITASVVVYLWWWLMRAIAGYRILSAQCAIANPYTWHKPVAADQAETDETKERPCT